jgi:hypothetical protein
MPKNTSISANNISLELLSKEPGLQIYNGKELDSGNVSGNGEFHIWNRPELR